MTPVEDTSAADIAAALDQVGARLKRLRTRRRMTLTGVAEATGISKSTMSRLETGQRRPTLELLLALSHTYRVPLDDLVAAPEEGDPRLRLKPGRVKGRTVIPLTRQPGGVQAWKIVIPTSKVTPEPRSHDGHEWIYVLSGHMRVVLGDRDRVLGPGEVAAFDTRVPHWFGSTGDEPAEILSIFGRPGEMMNARMTSVDGFTYDALPARIVFGPGAARTRLAGEVERLGARRLLLIASERVRGLSDPFADRVAATFTAVREHVPVATAEAARAAATGCDAVLCIGGGSTIGAAKAVALTARIPILAVPTTYSGSEVTAIWGTSENGRKTTGVDLAVLPRTVVYDPELTASLPRDLAVASGLNAMAHGVEALWAPGRNPVSAVIAEEGIAALAAGLRNEDPAELLRGAWLTASAFAVTGSGLHHKLCHVLGGMGMPHALTHAVVLPHVLAFNVPGAPGAATRMARALGADDPAAGLRALADRLGVPRGLRDLGLPEEKIDEVAALTEPVVPADNPVPVGDGALRRLVRRAWSGDTR